MSFSRSLARLEISAGVAVQRSIGRILALGKKHPNIKRKILARYFARQYLPVLLPQRPAQPSLPETIWQFWDNPAGRPTPQIVGACEATIDKWRGNFDHKILDMKTIGEYTDLPGYIYDRKKNDRMSFAHFADVLRLNLLKNHGGIWADATLYMNAPVPDYISREDFFVFLTDKLTHFPYSFMQNFFIRAKKGSWLNDAWYTICAEYWKDETKDIDYFQHQLMFKALVERDPQGRALFAKMPHVSEDQVIQFVDTLFAPFDSAEWRRIAGQSFLQKISYKDGRHSIADPAKYPGTFFEKFATGEL